jgi:hypothetical protein
MPSLNGEMEESMDRVRFDLQAISLFHVNKMKV